MLLTKLLIEHNPEVKQRLRKTIIKYGTIFGIAFIYLIFVLLTNIKIPCLFYELTGFKCVGCGVTRLFVSVAHLDFISAFKYNPYLFITGPFLITFLFFSELKYIRTGSSDMGKWEIFIWVEIALALVFGVIRNVLPI